MTTEAQKKAVKRYDDINTKRMTFKFNLKTDQDILKKLYSVDNRLRYIKELIRKDLGQS